jgi:hypothetical protein
MQVRSLVQGMLACYAKPAHAVSRCNRPTPLRWRHAAGSDISEQSCSTRDRDEQWEAATATLTTLWSASMLLSQIAETLDYIESVCARSTRAEYFEGK